MKNMRRFAVVFAILVICVQRPHASGPIGIYGIVEKIVFEPNEQAPERIQVWGAFAYADGVGDTGMGTSAVRRGYLYFKLPTVIAGFIGATPTALARKEWADLKAVAGTGQAVAFGKWSYIGGFEGLDPAVNNTRPPYLIQRAPQGGALTTMRVRPPSEAPASPTVYETNAGIVRLNADGSHEYIVKQLRAAIAATGGAR